MLDLLLVNVGGTKRRVYQGLSKDYSAVEPPFWAILTAGFIRNKGYEPDLLDANAKNLDIEKTAEEIVKRRPTLTNIVVYGQQPAASTQLMDGVGELCRKIKWFDKRRKIILTGLHPSALPERTMREEVCDYVGQGEGFHTLLGLLEGRPLRDVPGLWWREGTAILSNPRAQNIKDLDGELRDVAWDLLPNPETYKAHNWHCLHDLESRTRYASISTSLGCPYTCTFCSIHATFGERNVRFWSPEWVLRNIDELVQKYGIRNLKFIDELFIFNPDHYLPIAQGLIERGHNLNIFAYARIDSVREEHLNTLKTAGFNWLGLGIESGNPQVRKEISKKIEQDKIRTVVRKVKDAGINICGNFMFGFPTDNFDSMQETLNLALELNCEYPNFYCAMAYPGSQLYGDTLRRGTPLPETWTGFSQHSYECLPLPTEHLTAAQVLQFRDYSFNTAFTNPRYLDMIERKFGPKARRHFEEMTKIKLKRKLLGDSK